LDYLFVEGLPLVARPLPAALLITGNLKHFPAEVCMGIEVLAPATFIERWH
jgi:hypothetical protein